MELTSSVIAIISVLLGAGGIGTVINRNFNKRKARAEAESAEWELYDRRLDELHETITILNSSEKEQALRIADLNRALDGKTARIRKLTDLLYESEQNLNKANGVITSLTENIGKLKINLLRYRDWHCRNSECSGRIPPRPSLKGKSWPSPANGQSVKIDS